MDLKLNENLSHFKMCKVLLEQTSVVMFSYKSESYELDFSDGRLNPCAGYLIRKLNGGQVDRQLLMWLTLYFGESATDPYSIKNSTLSFVRGDLIFSEMHFLRFIRKIELRPLKSNPKWKNDFVYKALANYCMGVQMSVMYMPHTIGLFALSIECLTNASHDVRGKYSKLGNKGYKRIMNKALALSKVKDTDLASKIKNFIRYIDQEVDVIISLRNAYYGHGLIYEPEHRRKMSKCLGEWLVKHGFEKEGAKRRWFRDELLEESLEVNKNALFKLSLNVNRLLIFYYLGVPDKLPFTEFDFQVRNSPWIMIKYEHPERVA